MRRREFITLLGGAAAWPPAARGQQGERARRIGVLMGVRNSLSQSYLVAFEEALRQLGWVPGQNLHSEIRWEDANVQRDRIDAYAAELVALKPDAILVDTTPNLTAVRLATRTIPIVFIRVSDPLVQGFVPSLMRPGGNITGFGAYEFSIGGKWLDLLKQTVPTLARVAVIFNPETSPQSRYFVPAIKAAGSILSVDVTVVPVQSAAEIESAIADIARRPNGALIIPTGSFTTLHDELLIRLAALNRLPAIYANRNPVEKGGLMHYGVADFHDQFRLAAGYVDRILRGVKPGDLPVQLPTRYEFMIKLSTAKALGLVVPPTLLAIATEVLE
jgi:putative ABC transport system substrate-binding protein